MWFFNLKGRQSLAAYWNCRLLDLTLHRGIQHRQDTKSQQALCHVLQVAGSPGTTFTTFQIFSEIAVSPSILVRLLLWSSRMLQHTGVKHPFILRFISILNIKYNVNWCVNTYCEGSTGREKNIGKLDVSHTDSLLRTISDLEWVAPVDVEHPDVESRLCKFTSWTWPINSCSHCWHVLKTWVLSQKSPNAAEGSSPQIEKIQ